MAADGGKISASDPLEMWHAAFEQFFPAEGPAGAAGGGEDPARDPHYAEAAVDEMRAQKDETLERYRKQADRRARELAARHAAQPPAGKKAAAPPVASGSPKSSSRRSRGQRPAGSKLAADGAAAAPDAAL